MQMIPGRVRVDRRDGFTIDDSVADLLRAGSDVQVLAGVRLARALMVDYRLTLLFADYRSRVGGIDTRPASEARSMASWI